MDEAALGGRTLYRGAWLLLLSVRALAASATGASGVKVGEGRLHPFLEVDSRFQTNPGREPAGDSYADLSIVARPGLELVRPSSKFDVKLRLGLQYEQYLGLQVPDTRNLSNFAGELGLDGVINRDGQLVVTLSERLERSADPASQTITSRLDHTMNDMSLALEYMPGGGALKTRASIGLFYDYYDRNYADAAALDNLRIIPALRISWDFLPKTALFLEGQLTSTMYPGSGVFTNIPTNIVLSWLGAQGYITPRMTLVLKGGYGNTLISTADNFESVVGQLEFTYAYSEFGKLQVGYDRSAQPTSLFKFYSLDRGYVRLYQLVGTRLQISALGGVGYLNYGDALIGIQKERRDLTYSVGLSADFILTEWLVVSLVNQLEIRSSDYTSDAGETPAYVNNESLLRISGRY